MQFKSHHPEYRSWRKMHSRCSARSGRHFRLYGARGIVVCARWSDFWQFLADMGPMPSLRHSLERKDNDGPYCKENCVWATQKEQCNNQHRNIRVTIAGVTKTLMQWVELRGFSYRMVYGRIRRGWSPEDALSTPSLARSEWSTAKGARALTSTM